MRVRKPGLSRRGVLPKINTSYNEKVIDRAKTEIQAWLKQRGVDVQVRADLASESDLKVRSYRTLELS